MSTPLRERPDAPLGTLIFRAGLLPAETIESALEEGVKTGKRLGEILTERGLLKEVDLARLLAGQKGLEFVPVREHIVDPAAASLFTYDQARLFRALPYAFEDGIPVVAIPDPTDEVLLRNVREALGRDEVRFVVSTRGELAELVEDVYSKPLAAPDPIPAEPAASPADPEPRFVQDSEPAPPPEPEVQPDRSENGNGTLPDGVAEPAPVAEPAALPEVAVAAEEERAFPAPAAAVPAVPQPLVEPEAAAPQEQPLVPEPAALAEPTVAPPPPAAPEPVSQPEAAPAPEPVVLPEHAAPAAPSPAPVPLPDPVLPPAPSPYPPAASAPPTPDASPSPSGTRYDVTIRLTNGERVEAGVFQELDAAKERAKVLMTQVAAAAQGEWPFVSGRFLKPETIVSVDISEHTGSGPAPV